MNRERVLRAAIGLADRAGIESVSMRRLAQELDVEAMSLYHYVANTEDLVNGIVESVTSEIELPPPGSEWKSAIRSTALSAREAYLRHPWSAALVLSAGPNMPRFRYMNSMLGNLRDAGFSPSMIEHGYHLLESHIVGFTLWEVGMNLGTDENLAALAADVLRDLPRDELPHLVEHIEQHLQPSDPGEVGTFRFGLDLILDGLEQLHRSRG